MTNKQSVLITGASAGIGAIYADRFAARGHGLVLVSIDAEGMNAVAKGLREKYGVTVDVIRADLTAPDDLATVEARLRDDADIGILVNNAGASLGGHFVDQSVDAAAKLLFLNALAPLRLARAVAPRLANAGAGAIVNISSVMALAPEYGMIVYSATKAFVQQFSHGLSVELGPKGVYVQTVMPGPTRTQIWESAGVDMRTLPATMEVEKMVDAALIGFDRRETITFPALYEEEKWGRLEEVRQTLLASTSPMQVAKRYQATPHQLR